MDDLKDIIRDTLASFDLKLIDSPDAEGRVCWFIVDEETGKPIYEGSSLVDIMIWLFGFTTAVDMMDPPSDDDPEQEHGRSRFNIDFGGEN